jgi:hypothetical protein
VEPTSNEPTGLKQGIAIPCFNSLGREFTKQTPNARKAAIFVNESELLHQIVLHNDVISAFISGYVLGMASKKGRRGAGIKSEEF